MKIRNLFYIYLIFILVFSFFSCDLTQNKELITENTEIEQTKAHLVQDCPPTSLSGTNVSGSFNCGKESAYMFAGSGSGTLTFLMSTEYSSIKKYRITGKIKNYKYGSGHLYTPAGTVYAGPNFKSFDFTWTRYSRNRNFYIYGASHLGGGVIVENLKIYWLVKYP